MADSSVDGDYEGSDATDSENEGYAEPGGYSDPAGYTGYSGLTSDYPDDVGGSYDASVGATFGVLGPLIELGGGALAAAFAAQATAEAIGEALMAADLGLEGGAAVVEDP